ncbi:transglutaminase-like domain-containing protein [Oleiharenicola lentus]|uniref:transglutaminase-like domain-containing protein n=1 Tax=Oleiharenicola lentus TaxID=2508720 RepID=UPI003F67A826
MILQESASPADLLTVRIGCKFIYEVSVPTPALLDIEPHLEGVQQLLGESLSIGGGLPTESVSNSHDNHLLRLTLPPGETLIQHDALVEVLATEDLYGVEAAEFVTPDKLPADYLRYVLPSRFCESDRLASFAWQTFGHLPVGWPRAKAVSDWVHHNIEYRFGSGHFELSAWDIFQRRYGVCRDFAHLTIALCRALNIPARYVTGHLPDIGFIDPGSPMDFHAYAEIWLGGRWFALDARFNVPRIGRVKISHGRDAVDCAFFTTFGAVKLNYFEVWAYQIERGTVHVGDPIDLTKRLDGTLTMRRTLAR